MEQVKDHPYVTACEEARPIIIETLTFLYDLDMISTRDDEVKFNNFTQKQLILLF